MTLSVPRLRSVPGAAEPDPPGVLPPPPPEITVTPAVDGETPAGVIALAFRTARRSAGDAAEREGGWVNSLLAGQPPSLNHQREYLARRAWLPHGHEGGIADQAGEAYHVAIGLPWVAAFNAASRIASRPFTFCWAWGALLLTASAACLLVTHSRGAAAAVALTAAAVPAVWVALVAGVLALTRRALRRREAGRG